MDEDRESRVGKWRTVAGKSHGEVRWGRTGIGRIRGMANERGQLLFM